jgi:hypothetical protein
VALSRYLFSNCLVLEIRLSKSKISSSIGRLSLTDLASNRSLTHLLTSLRNLDWVSLDLRISAFLALNFLLSYLGLKPSKGRTFSQKSGSFTLGAAPFDFDAEPPF